MPDKTEAANSKVIHPKFWGESYLHTSRFTDGGLISPDKLVSAHEMSLVAARPSTSDNVEPIAPPMTEDLAQAEPPMHPANSAFIEVGYSYDWRDALEAKIKAYELRSYVSVSKWDYDYLRLEIARHNVWMKASGCVHAWPFDPEIQYGYPLLAFLPENEDQYLGLPYWHGGAVGLHAYLVKRGEACRESEEMAVLLAMATSQRRCLEAKFGPSVMKVFKPILMVIDGHKAHFVTADVSSTYLDSLATAEDSRSLVGFVSYWTTSPKLDLRNEDDKEKCDQIQAAIVKRFEKLLETLKSKTSPSGMHLGGNSTSIRKNDKLSKTSPSGMHLGGNSTSIRKNDKQAHNGRVHTGHWVT